MDIFTHFWKTDPIGMQLTRSQNFKVTLKKPWFQQEDYFFE